MLGLVVAPTVSHALAAEQASLQPWSELCTQNDGEDAGARLAHCPLCAQPGQWPVLPGVSVGAGLIPEAGDAPVAMAERVALPVRAWVAPRSRASPRAASA